MPGRVSGFEGVSGYEIIDDAHVILYYQMNQKELSYEER